MNDPISTQRAERLTMAKILVRRAAWRNRHAQNQQYICPRCGKRMQKGMPDTHPDRITLDHIIPLGRGGPDIFENTQAMCYACNCAKADSEAGKGHTSRRKKYRGGFVKKSGAGGKGLQRRRERRAPQDQAPERQID